MVIFQIFGVMVFLSKPNTLNAVEIYPYEVSNTSAPTIEIRDMHHQIATAFLNIQNQQRNLIHVPFSVNNSLPWECESRVLWHDLGALYYPRYISRVECLETSCWYGHCTCNPVMLTLKVLKLNRDNSDDTILPPVLRPHWTLADVETSVFCQCSR